MYEKDFELIVWRFGKTQNAKWMHLGQRHFALIPLLLDSAENDERFYFSVLLHLNCVFEGGLKLLGEKKNLVINQNTRLESIINELHANGTITTSVKARLKSFKDDYRNKYTHEVFSSPSKQDALDAVTETYFLALVMMSLYQYSGRIGDNELDKAVIEGFCEAFGLYVGIHEIFTGEDRHIRSVEIESIRQKILEAHRRSIFSRIFSLEFIRNRRTGFHFRMIFTAPGGRTRAEWKLRVQRLIDLPADDARIHNEDVGENVFYLVFKFTGRTRATNYIESLESGGIPHFVIDVARKARGMSRGIDAAADYLILDNWLR